MSLLLVLSWSRWHRPGKVHDHHDQLQLPSGDISIIFSRPGEATGLCVPLLLPGPGTWMLQRLVRPLSLTLSTALPTGAGPSLPGVMLQWVRFSACTTWECTFNCNTPNYLFLFVPLNGFGIYFWSFLILILSLFSAPSKIKAKSSSLLSLKQSHSQIYIFTSHLLGS